MTSARTPLTARSPSRSARAAFAAVRGYQRLMAALGRPSPCRFIPTCSMYALDAYQYHGFWQGTWLTARRLARCHPWGRTGWDPVPALRRPGDPPTPQPFTTPPAAANRPRRGKLR